MSEQRKETATSLADLKSPKWNIYQVLYLLLMVYGLEWLLGWLQAPNFLSSMKGFFSYTIIGLGEAALFIAAVVIFLKILRAPLQDLGLTRFHWRSLLFGVSGGVFLFVFVGLMGNFMINILGVPDPQSFALVVQGANDPWQFVILMVLGGVIVPLKEEVVFRGLVYPPLRQAYGKKSGIFLTGVFFGIMHFDLVRFFPLFLGGMVLAWLYEKTRTLWTSVIAHGVWNVLMVVLMWVQKG